MTPSQTTDLQGQCDLLRSLHRPGDSSPASERLGRGHGESGRRGRLSRGRDHQRRAWPRRSATRTRRVRRRRDARRGRADCQGRRGAGDRRRRGRLRDAARRAGRRAAERRGGRLQPRGHRLHRRRPPRSRPARGMARGGSPGRLRGRLPARDQRPGRRLPRPLPRRRGPGPKRSSFPRRSGARTPNSRRASTACTRSPCGRGRAAPLHLGSRRPGERVRLPQTPSSAERPRSARPA